MRRLMLLAGVLALSGCSNMRDLFKAHADEVATAGSLTLTPERLADILTGPKGVRLNSDAANYVTGLWMDYALFAQGVAQHQLPADSAAVAQALWPAIAQIKAERWHDTIVSKRLNLTDAGLDSLFVSGPLRVFQHILFTTSQTATPEERQVARKKAEDALAQVKKGANFGALASKLSQDPGSARDSGYLPPSPKGRFVTAFDSAGWSLAPGEVSGIVETPYGYHVIKRPLLADARGRFRESAEGVVVAHVDSVYFDSLAHTYNLQIKSSAPAKMREAMSDMDGARGSTTELATWKGGSLTVGGLMRWVSQLPPPYQDQIRQLPDSQLGQYARVVSQNEMLLQQADSAKVGPSAEEWAGLRQQYQAQVDSLKAEMGIGADLSDSSVSASQRNEMADLKIKTYFDRIIEGKVRARRLPALLGDVLRQRIKHHIYEGGVQRGLELAQHKKAQEEQGDTGAQAAPPATGLRPAPGPAPAPSGNAQPAAGAPAAKP